MHALIAILGPLKGTQIPVDEDEITIGRDHANQLPIPDLLLSRRHCLIRKNGNDYVIQDLDSRNGVFVNSIPVGERTLQHGDQIEIGNSLFVFTSHEEEWKQAEDLPGVDAFVGKSTISLRIGNPLEIAPDPQDLTLLLRITHSLNSVQNLKELGERLLELMFDSIPAQRAAFFLYSESASEFNHVCSHWRKSQTDQVNVSRSLMLHVVENKAAFLANDVLQNEQVKKTDSLLASSPHSVICAPFILFDQVFGLLYLDTFDPQYKFNEHHLQLAGAIAGLAAPAIRNIQNYEAALEASRNLRAELQMDRELVGESSSIRKVFEFVRRTSHTDSTILITGESGTGKELVAQAIHGVSVTGNSENYHELIKS